LRFARLSNGKRCLGQILRGAKKVDCGTTPSRRLGRNASIGNPASGKGKEALNLVLVREGA
jgi:hypothetical protein